MPVYRKTMGKWKGSRSRYFTYLSVCYGLVGYLEKGCSLASHFVFRGKYTALSVSGRRNRSLVGGLQCVPGSVFTAVLAV